jgi:hypothetical protein
LLLFIHIEPKQPLLLFSWLNHGYSIALPLHFSLAIREDKKLKALAQGQIVDKSTGSKRSLS